MRSALGSSVSGRIADDIIRQLSLYALGLFLVSLSTYNVFYNGHVLTDTTILTDTTNIENGIMLPLPRRSMGPDRNCRQLDCPVPIAHRGRGSAEGRLEGYLFI